VGKEGGIIMIRVRLDAYIVLKITAPPDFYQFGGLTIIIVEVHSIPITLPAVIPEGSYRHGNKKVVDG
jgi:hypothetical protein